MAIGAALLPQHAPDVRLSKVVDLGVNSENFHCYITMKIFIVIAEPSCWPIVLHLDSMLLQAVSMGPIERVLHHNTVTGTVPPIL